MQTQEKQPEPVASDAGTIQFWDKVWSGDKPPAWKFEEEKKQPESNYNWLNSSLPAEWKTTAARVFIPLCGDSPILSVFTNGGHRVVGVEGVATAVDRAKMMFGGAQQFQISETKDGKTTIHRAKDGKIDLHQGDFFQFQSDEKFGLCYDRGSLIALPVALRSQYLNVIKQHLTQDAYYFLDVVQRPPETRTQGPPFHAGPEDVQALFTESGEFKILHTRPGLAANNTQYMQYILQRQPPAPSK